jgi:predicted DNA-binding transcriptional regulator AlpA
MAGRIYIFRELKAAGVRFTRKHVSALEKRGDFPKRIHLTDFSVGWVAEEVDAWVQSKIDHRDALVAEGLMASSGTKQPGYKRKPPPPRTAQMSSPADDTAKRAAVVSRGGAEARSSAPHTDHLSARARTP